MHTQFFSRLSQNYIELLKDDEYYDATIEVGEDPNVKIFRAHTNILCYRSPYLRRVLVSEKKNNGLVHIKLQNISPEIFQIILEYIYGGILSLNGQDTSDFLKTLTAANVLHLQELVDYLQKYLIENKSEWLEQHFGDDLQMKEIEVWEHVLKWGLAQNPTLISDPNAWSDDDFRTMENTLQHCLPLVRFFSLSSVEFSQKVHPYKKLLKHQFYEELLNSYLDPNREPIENILLPRNMTVDNIIDSRIVNLNIVSIISRWIDRTDLNYKFSHLRELYFPYQFKLLLRGSRDGFTPKKFHELCDVMHNTVTFIKLKGSEEIIGGYNPLKWETPRNWGITKDSFIFSFKNKDNYKDTVISNVKNLDSAIFSHPLSGPIFGKDIIMHAHNENTDYDTIFCRKFCYDKKIRDSEKKFFIDDYEVFQIKKRRV
ncbi:hypothetical protein GLOIN_2v1882540 [Rhizophagus clarus]|uniref:BTB domain-containing protein n=1 Tax=Rhizophagus clarus TaxID=94130 RepID=A0A8H3QUZ8_9GLOM|nr:hypothetical protein GLOIN_2v1882540 [Rhizophagus clarus]